MRRAPGNQPEDPQTESSTKRYDCQERWPTRARGVHGPHLSPTSMEQTTNLRYMQDVT